MAIISGYLITEDQATRLLKYNGDQLHIDQWPDQTVTIHNGDEIIIEFIVGPF